MQHCFSLTVLVILGFGVVPKAVLIALRNLTF